MQKYYLQNPLFRTCKELILTVYATDMVIPGEEYILEKMALSYGFIDPKYHINPCTFFVFSMDNKICYASIIQMNPDDPTVIVTQECYKVAIYEELPKGTQSRAMVENLIQSFLRDDFNYQKCELPEEHKARINNAFELARNLYGNRGDQSIFDAPRPR